MMEIRLELGSIMIRGCVSLLLKLLGWVFQCQFTRKTIEHDGILEERKVDDKKLLNTWTVDSWKNFPIKQSPPWPNLAELERALQTVRRSAPLVQAQDVLKLRDQLAQVARGERFLLQGGDCAEQFSHATFDIIQMKVKTLMDMSSVLETRVPTTRLARMAGQYAKPRSSPFEADGITPSFFGENVNTNDKSRRTPDPQRLIEGYNCAAQTLAHVRNILDKTEDMPNSVDANQNQDGSSDLFVSHEALLLNYESALTRKVNGKFYNLSAHFIWIGDRTRQLDHGHLEYVRGIQNPIGIKVGPSMSGAEIVQLLNLVWPNPQDPPGRVTLITRYGADKIEKILPGHIQAVQSTGHPVVWITDPCHGNTFATPNGYKTRDFGKVLEEIRLASQIHKALGSRLGGVHLEMTGEDVTECVGGPQGLTFEDLPRAYQTLCDPRLNYAQSIEMAARVSELI